MYGKMSFATRDRYRHVLETIARKSTSSEGEVANHAVRLALESWHKQESHAGHVGFYSLMGTGGRLSNTQSIHAGVDTGRLAENICRQLSLLLYGFNRSSQYSDQQNLYG